MKKRIVSYKRIGDKIRRGRVYIRVGQRVLYHLEKTLTSSGSCCGSGN